MSKVVDMIGKKYGRLTILERKGSDKHGNALWLCKCECGNQIIACGTLIRQNKIQSCGCLHQEIIKKHIQETFIDETGNKYGKLTVIKRAKNKENDSRAYWECKCECGNTCIINGSLLRNGKTRSCGCIQKEFAKKHIKILQKNQIINEVGNRYGKLVVLEQATNETPIKWKCKCDCGNICIVNGRSLRNGERIDCGCSSISKGEFKIQNLLEENKIIYSKQYTQKIEEHLLRFDFAIYNKENQIKYLIEFDGEQHFKSVNYFGGDKKFKEVTYNDNLKNQWCKNNNIPLIRIPYNHLNNLCIEDLKLETSKFII